MTIDESQRRIQEMVRRIVEDFHPERVVLFGSYARGTEGPDSDVDLLVVLPVLGKRLNLAVQIRGRLHGLGLAKDIVIATPEEWVKQRDIAGTLIRTVHEEGKTLYERAA
jgi:uncharacterized protein